VDAFRRLDEICGAMVTKRWPLEEINETFADLEAGVDMRTALEINGY
jgi:Zn-dependent alcohol dehydrogenase